MEANKAYFMVRAQVPSESERAKFDQWYGTHHLPLAMDTLHADKGWRSWSRSDPSVHYAMYEFKDMATLRNCVDSPAFGGCKFHFPEQSQSLLYGGHQGDFE